MTEDDEIASIRKLNDTLRRTGQGGRTMITRGIQALDEPVRAGIRQEVSIFDDFTPDNDPYGEHDCAVMTVEGVRIIWKIDYYDRTMRHGSEDPSNPEMTVRVLTIMLAEEY